MEMEMEMVVKLRYCRPKVTHVSYPSIYSFIHL